MIAANMMEIDMAVLCLDKDHCPDLRTIASLEDEVIPVVHGDGRMAGVLRRKDLLRVLQGPAPKGPVVASLLGEVLQAGYLDVGPEAGLEEILEMHSRAGEDSPFVFVTDNSGRLLGRLCMADVEKILSEYREARG